MAVTKVDVIDLLIVLSAKIRGWIWIIDGSPIPELPIDMEVLCGECENEECKGHTCNGGALDVTSDHGETWIKRCVPTIRRNIAMTTTAWGKGNWVELTWTLTEVVGLMGRGYNTCGDAMLLKLFVEYLRKKP